MKMNLRYMPVPNHPDCLSNTTKRGFFVAGVSSYQNDAGEVAGVRVSNLDSCRAVGCNIWVFHGVSKNRGTPKWMVYRENPIRIDDLGVPLFLETPI